MQLEQPIYVGQEAVGCARTFGHDGLCDCKPLIGRRAERLEESGYRIRASSAFASASRIIDRLYCFRFGNAPTRIV
jgi:hypothetical protein